MWNGAEEESRESHSVDFEVRRANGLHSLRVAVLQDTHIVEIGTRAVYWAVEQQGYHPQRPGVTMRRRRRR